MSSSAQPSPRRRALRSICAATVAMMGISSVQFVPSESPLGILSPAIANAATITLDDASSWSEALRDGLAGDVVPITEGTGEAPWQTNNSVQSSNVSGTVTWNKNIGVQDGSLNPWLYDVRAQLAKAYNTDVNFPSFNDGQEFDSGDIPGAIPGFTFRWKGNDLLYIDCDYTKMTPLATAKDESKVTIPEIGEWTLPSPLEFKNMETVTSGDKSFVTSFVPAKNYAGVVPPLPVYISNGGNSTSVKYLTTKPTNKANHVVMMSSAFGSATQQAPYESNHIFSNLRKDTTSPNWDLKYNPFGLLDPNDPDGTEASETLKKDGGTYKVDEFGVVTFTPDPGFNNFGTQTTPGRDLPTDPGRLEGVEVVTMTVKGQKYDPNGNQILGETTPLYQLPKDDARRSWAVRMYQPLVLQETVEVSNVEAFGKIGSPITATPDYSQDSGMPAIDLRSVSFVDGPNGEYPAAAQRTKTVDGEGTWTINDNGSFTFTPETGFAGHPAPVYYKAKNVNDIVSADDGDDNDGRTGVGIVTYTYSDSSGLYANTTGPQGEAQTSFDTTDSDDAGFKDAKAMFRNIPDHWFDRFTYKLRGADAQGKVVVDGQGTYTIDANTGKVTFTPLASYSGTAQPAYIEIASGYRNANGQIGSPSAIYTPTVVKSPVVVRPQFGSGSIGAEITVTPDYTQPDGLDPIDKASITFLNEDGSYPDTPIKSRTIAGQGEWTIDNDGNFTFTPVPGFAGDPAQQPYTAKNTKGVFAAPANVGVVYGGVVTLPSTTVGPQNTVQHSDDTDASDNGLTRDKMFPNLPEDWFTDNGSPLTTKLVNANGDLVDTVTVDGKGTYTIDPDTGKVTFTPIATFVGKADPVTIAVDGLKYASGKSVPVRTTYTPFVTKDGTVLPNASHVASAVGEPDTVTPSYTDNGFNIDPTSAVFPDGSKTKQVDGEGTWTINPDTGAFTFTPEPGFTGSPTPVSYSAVGRDTGMRVDGGQVTIAYPDAYTKPATTVGPQGQPQTSTTTGGQNAGLQAEDMFPTVPTEWFGANATKRRGDGSPLVQFFLKDADGNNVTELEVTGKNPDTGLDEVAGIYTIDSITGAVKFTPRQEFLGSAPAAVITTDGLSTELTSGYTPYLFPPRVELPSGNETAPALGVPVVIGDDEDLIWAGGSGSAAFMVNKESIQLLPNTDGSTVSDDGKTLTVPGEGTWSVTLVGDAPAPGAEDTRRVEFTFTPEKGFISDPTPLDYTAKNTDGVQSTTPGQIVASYPYATPADAVTTAPQGVTQTAADNNSPDDQGKTIAQMFPKISQLPADWNVTYKLQDGDGNPVDSVTIDGQGTYSIDNQGLVSFVPEAGFTGTADGVTIVPLVDGEQLISGINGSFIPASAKYTAVVTGFGTPPVTTTTRPVDYRTVIVSDDSLTVGESVVETKGELGEETLQADGTWTLTTAAKDQVIRVGAKPVTGSDTVVWTDPIPYETTYRENPDLKPGEVKEVQAGVLGETTNTVTVTFDAQGKPTQSAPVSEVTKQPVERILEYGPGADDQRTIERVDTIPFETEYVIDDTLKEGETKVVQEGQTGSRTVSTTVTVVDGKIVGEPAIDEKVIKEPVKRIVRIGVSKTIVPTPEVEEVPFETKVVFDPTMDPGTQKETQPGKPGVRELIDGTWVVTTQPKDRVIAVGSKVLTGEDEVKWVAEIPFETQVRVNPDLQPGEHRVVQEGTPGKETFSVKFTLNPDGTVSREESSARTVEPVTKIIEVGPQTSYPSTFEDTSTIPFNTEVIYDDTLLAGESVVDQEGVDGERTTSYVIDLVDGNIVVGEPTVTAKDPVKRIIRVGTKPPAPVPSDPDKPEPGQQSSGNSVIERCFANGFALNSPLMWLLPIVLFAAIGSPLAATMQRIVGQAIGEFNNTALGRQASEADRQLRRQLGLGGSNDDWTRRFQQAFAGDNQQLARLNAELGKLNSQYGEQIRIGAAIAAGLALTGLLATQACSEEGFAGWGIPASSSEADKDAAAQAGAETSSRLGSSSASEPGAR